MNRAPGFDRMDAMQLRNAANIIRMRRKKKTFISDVLVRTLERMADDIEFR